MSHFTVKVQSPRWLMIRFDFLTSIPIEKYPKVDQTFGTFIKSERRERKREKLQGKH